MEETIKIKQIDEETAEIELGEIETLTTEVTLKGFEAENKTIPKEKEIPQKQEETLDTLTLPISGIEVKMNLNNINGHLLLKARKAADSAEAVGSFLIAEVSTFDGQKKTAFDILDMDMEDVLTLEEFFAKKKAQRNLMHKKSLQYHE